MRARELRRFGIGLVLTTLALYLAVLAGLFVLQRSLMYFPNPAYEQPDRTAFPTEEVKLHTSDGQTLVAWYLPPKPGKPVILHFFGNGAGLGLEKWRWQRIGQAGVGFLAVAYRGYSGSTGSPTEDGLHIDARTGYDWLAKRHPASDIVIYGHSLGTGLAVKLAAERPARALILEAPFSAAVDRAAEQYPWVPVKLLMRDQFLSRRWIKQVHAPVLIVHGDHDSVIPFEEGQRLYREANSPKEFVQMIGSD
ncbi:MAG TPA: alpha/beta hydrolase, partial [Caulobacteraceae bacterium]|nr:alpha/beta hydrolase [Caulobacteraceae bacterium]